MVYELRTYTLIPGKMPEYLKAADFPEAYGPI